MKTNDHDEPMHTEQNPNRNDSDIYDELYRHMRKNEPEATVEYTKLGEHNVGKKGKQKTILVAAAVVLVVLIVVFAIPKVKKPPEPGETTAVSRVVKTTAAHDETSLLPAHIFFDANGGMADFTERYGYVGEKYDQLPNVEREGYSFEGWFSEKEGGERITSNTKIRNEYETAYAHWIEITTRNKSDEHKEKETAATSSFRATTVQVKTTQAATTRTTTTTTTKIAAFALSYNANGGSGAPARQSGGTRYTVSYTEPQRSGYTFLGWSKDSFATAASYHGGDSVILSDNVTLYAVWKQNRTYTVYFDANGGSSSPSYKTVDEGSTVRMPTPYRTNYNFLGWYTSPSGGARYTDSTRIDSNITLYAHWEQNPSTLQTTFTPSVTWENENPCVHFDCSVKSNYQITDYKISNNLTGTTFRLNPDCSGKYCGQNMSGNFRFTGYPAGTSVVFTVTASDSSGNTVTNDYYATL